MPADRRHSGFSRYRAATVCALLGLLGPLAACSSSSGDVPNTASSATVVPGDVPTLGDGSGGGISVTGASIMRTGTKLAVTAQIHNGQSTADELVQVGSNVGPTLTLQPALKIPAGATVKIDGASGVVLDQTGRLEPGGTVALSWEFGNAGAVQVFSSFHDASSAG